MAKTKKETAVEVKKANVPAVQSESAAWGMEEITAQDIILPKLLLMQGLSKIVTAGDAAQGQIVNSVTKEVVGGISNIKTKAGEPVELVCFKLFKTWVEFDKIEGQWVFRKTYPMDASNLDLAQEEIVSGVEVRRDRCMNFMVLLPSEIEEGAALPYVVSFRRTSMQAGKKIASAQKRWQALGAANPVCHKTFKMSVIQKTKDDKNFWAFEMEEGRETSAEEQAECKKWFTALQKMNAKIDDSDLNESAPVETETVTEY